VRPELPPGPYLVVGLARSGTAAMRLLSEHGEVAGVDSGAPEVDLPNVHLRTDGLELLDGVRTVVKSPGVRPSAPVVEEARRRGLDVVGELEIAWRLMPNDFIAVTGTNGKTTTVELLGAIHRAAGIPVEVAGNVGTPLASLVGGDPGTVIVCEASSFQLADSSAFAPDAAVLLNLAPDHLDWHGGFEAYRDAKLRIFANQRPDQVAVVPPGFEVPGEGRRIEFGEHDLEDVERIRLRGPHNRANAMAAAAVAAARGVDRDAIREALRTFPGVPHRLEEVAVRDGVTYVNDSKATNVASAAVALRSFRRGVHAILGGSLKGESFTGLREPIEERCAAIYLIGEAAEQLERELGGIVPTHRSGDLERALAEASAAAKEGDVVLLSPACASYDQFRDYEERGDRFRDLICRICR
jgi:UDP-N-acetylmuramoylalanine--D-glutamate ligase